MTDQWYMVYAKADGTPVSSGTVLASELVPAGTVASHPQYGDVVAVELPHEPDWGKEQWNPQTLQLEPTP